MLTLGSGLIGGALAAALRRRRTKSLDQGGGPSKGAALIALGLLLLALIGPLAYDSMEARVAYFPDRAFDEKQAENQFTVDWYSSHLRAMNEPSLWALAQADRTATAYRLLWLPSFNHPAAIRLVRSADAKGGTLRLVILDGMGGSEPGQIAIERTKSITREQWNKLEQGLARTEFWTMPTTLKDEDFGVEDGDQLILEGIEGGRYHLVDRSEGGDDYLALCRSLMELSDSPWMLKALGDYH